MDSLTLWIVAVFFFGGVFGLIGVYIAMQKGRSEGEGFFLGCLLGPLGLILAALLPNQERDEQPGKPRPVKFRESSPDEDWRSIQDRMR